MKNSANNESIQVESTLLNDFMIAAFKKLGVPSKDARVCADVILTASLKGIDSHGVDRFKSYYYDRLKTHILQAVTTLEVVRKSPTTAVIDGHNGMGQVIGKKAMELAIKKAKRYGTGMVVVRNSSHYGIAGYYTKLAIDQNLIGISGTNTRSYVAPTNGVENILGTNPIAFGFPTDEAFPFIMDAATSLAQKGKIELYAKKGGKLPTGWVVGHDGEYITDPHLALDGILKDQAALTSMGSPGISAHKGYGLAIVVEILSSALQQGSYLKLLNPANIGHFFFAIDIQAFTDITDFKTTTGNIVRSLRSSKKVNRSDRIFTPGEKSYITFLERKEKGIPVNRILQKELLAIQKEQNLDKFRFPF